MNIQNTSQLFLHLDIPKNFGMLHKKNPGTHQWYRINTHEITDSHNIAIINDTTVNMVWLPPAEPNKANTIETFARLTTPNSQMEDRSSY